MVHCLRLPALLLLIPVSWAASACRQAPEIATHRTGTPELRAALFDTVLARTSRRAAFSVPKERLLGYDPLLEMERLRDEIVQASSEDELFYALLRLSNARRDRHLSLGLVEGGLRPDLTDGIETWSGPPASDPREAPVRFRPDYGSSSGGYFISDVAVDLGGETPGLAERIAAGDRVLSVNGLSATELENTLRPYIRHSSAPGFRWKLAEALSLRTGILPPSFRQETLILEVRKPDGEVVIESLPYLQAGSIEWTRLCEPAYPGFTLEWSTPTYDLYLADSVGQAEGPREERVGVYPRVLLLQWHRFESSSLTQDVGRLAEFGEEGGLLDYAVIFDATRSGGGSLGAYAIQRIQPNPFRTTFGTLRLSEIIEPFVQEKREEFAAQRIYDSGGPETVDDGTWLMDWLENEVLEALHRGDSVTTPVPFKLAHAPKDSDGVLQPAPVHFQGPLVVFSGPHGGSHLDQFMSIVVDNDLGYVLGMPPGGYSNTWEWSEVLSFPEIQQPLVGFMWSIGHTIRPNGEVLEGNPAQVDEWVPLTADNADHYYQILLERAWNHLREIGFPGLPS